MNATCPRLVIAGTASGVGKTSLALGIVRSLTRQGLRVQTFKVGPDFLDPTYLALASGRTCYNLDGWMTSRDYVTRLFSQATADADIAIVEGVMGLFDGASPAGIEGSTAEIAQWIDATVLLVCNAHGASRSLAATVKGFAEFECGVRIGGVIANQCGTLRHRAMLQEALAAANLPPLVGAVPRGSLARLESRHLGLVTADRATCDDDLLDEMADACAVHIDLAAVMALAGTAGVLMVDSPEVEPLSRSRIRLGIARDEAFHFYYPDNLDMLERLGAELVEFSPIRDAALPDALDAVIFGGGYPEVYAGQLAANAGMLSEVRQFAASGRPIYGECGGLIYLGRSLITLDGRCHPMAGVVPVDTVMCETRKVLGYAEASWNDDCLWGRAGQGGRGHEFHYSEVTHDDSAAAGWRPAYRLCRRATGAAEDAGYAKGRIMAGYVHFHWASQAEAARHFISLCERTP